MCCRFFCPAESFAFDSRRRHQGYVYESPLIEQGSVILGGTQQEFGFALRQQYFHKSVMLLLQHDDGFTKGIILNRPSAYELDGWRVWFGGDVAEGELATCDCCCVARAPTAGARARSRTHRSHVPRRLRGQGRAGDHLPPRARGRLGSATLHAHNQGRRMYVKPSPNAPPRPP